MLDERTGSEITYGFAKYGAFVRGVLRQCIKVLNKGGGGHRSRSQIRVIGRSLSRDYLWV